MFPLAAAGAFETSTVLMMGTILGVTGALFYWIMRHLAAR